MCGAYSLDKELDELMERFSAAAADFSYRKRFNVRPTQSVPVILNTRPDEIALVRWGITPSWAKTKSKQLINARKDGLHKPTFSKSFRERRCLVLADGFYEWKSAPAGGPKRPFRFTLKDGEPFAFAGLWREQEDGEAHCAIITTEPNELVAKVHDRMPAILKQKDEADWLNLDTTPDEALGLIQSYPEKLMCSYEVSRLVNLPGRDTPEVLKPLA